MRASGPLRSAAASYFTYTLGRSLHVPLTSRCNGRTLPQLRGDGFSLPAHVVAALCRVRDAERMQQQQWQQRQQPSSPTSSSPQWAGWCAYLDTQGGYQKLPPPDEPSVARLESPPPSTVREPKVDDLLEEIRRQLVDIPPSPDADGALEAVVLSGEGEPTLRWDDMVELAKKTRALLASTPGYNDLPIRLTTNGLVVPGGGGGGNDDGGVGNDDHDDDNLSATVQALVDCGISRVSVALMTADAEQYHDIVRPKLPAPQNGDDDSTATTTTATTTITSAHDAVCRFIREAARVGGGLEVEITAVDRADVDKAKTEALSRSLGVSKPVRWRPYFP